MHSRAFFAPQENRACDREAKCLLNPRIYPFGGWEFGRMRGNWFLFILTLVLCEKKNQRSGKRGADPCPSFPFGKRTPFCLGSIIAVTGGLDRSGTWYVWRNPSGAGLAEGYRSLHIQGVLTSKFRDEVLPNQRIRGKAYSPGTGMVLGMLHFCELKSSSFDVGPMLVMAANEDVYFQIIVFFVV